MVQDTNIYVKYQELFCIFEPEGESDPGNSCHGAVLPLNLQAIYFVQVIQFDFSAKTLILYYSPALYIHQIEIFVYMFLCLVKQSVLFYQIFRRNLQLF